MNIVIPMAGLGSRFKVEGYNLPKPLIRVNELTLAEHSIKTIGLEGRYVFIARTFDDPRHNEELSQVLKKVKPDSVEIRINQTTRGAAETVLFARTLVDSDEELVITNCDQILRWNAQEFIGEARKAGVDGAVLLYPTTDPKNSFAVLEHGSSRVLEIVEKKAVSGTGLVGLHYWRRGSDFARSADRLLKDFMTLGKKECYVSETYNYLIAEGQTVLGVVVEANQYIPLGTPSDLALYLGKLKEFYTTKPKTIFCDIDGTVLKHVHRFSDLNTTEPSLLPDVLRKFNEWDSQGHKVVLCTARKESARAMTEEHLSHLGLCWDVLLMGMTSGCRVVVNDKLHNDDPNRAQSVNVITDQGFGGVNWEEFGL